MSHGVRLNVCLEEVCLKVGLTKTLNVTSQVSKVYVSRLVSRKRLCLEVCLNSSLTQVQLGHVPLTDLMKHTL
jgi:hypothetical protein